MTTTDPLLTALIERHYVYPESRPDGRTLYEVTRNEHDAEFWTGLMSWDAATAPATIEDALRSYYQQVMLTPPRPQQDPPPYTPNTDDGVAS